MKRLKYLCCVFMILFFLSCDRAPVEKIIDQIITEKDLVPEGVTFDPATSTIYIGSTYKRKIVSIDKNGKISDFITEGQDDIKSVIGMEVDTKRNCLWAISSEAKQVLPLKNPGSRQWWSSVYQYDLKNGKLLKKYLLNRDSVFLNDITVADDGTVYVTETRNAAIYKLDPGKDTLSIYLNISPYTFANGICFTDKPGLFFVSCSEGILSIELATKKITLLPAQGENKALSIDGLSFSDNYFIGHQSKRVCRFYLSPGRDSIIRSDTLNSGPEFDSSTTGEKGNGYYHFIVNSQIQSGVDYARQEIKPADSLTNIIIRKIKL